MSYEFLKKLRVQNGFTQKYVAAKLHISQSGYSKIENGESGIDIEKIKILSDLYGIEIEYIVKELT